MESSCCAGIYRTIDSRALEKSYYKSEGNTYMVIALPDERKVLRLRKSDEKNYGDKPAEDGGLSRVELDVNFYKNTMSKLMEGFSSEPQIAICDVDDLNEHLKRFEAHRPDNRRHKNVVENFATVLPDYTLLRSELLEKCSLTSNWPTFCFEIKPKEPRGPHFTSTFDSCPYCHPSPDRDKVARPTYCPGCLFSGEKVRTFASISALIAERSKRCKIFKNGHLLRSGKIDLAESPNDSNDEFGSFHWLLSKEIFVEIVAEALLREFRRPDSRDEDQPVDERHQLPKNSVLGTINRCRDRFRADVRSVYEKYAKKSCTLEDRTVYGVDEFQEDVSSDLISLKRYLVYRIIRDCSILVTFQQIDTPMDVPKQHVFEARDCHFAVNVAVTDLDPKSVHCIEKHYRKTRRQTDRAIL